MATWYAQKGSCNIDSVSGGTTSDVWNAAAGGGGAWMDTSVLTAGGDTVLATNAQTAIAVNISINLGTGRLTNVAEGGTIGGGFTVAGAVTITADLTQAATAGHLVATSGAGYTLTIVGDITGGSGSTGRCVSNAVAVNITVTGNVAGDRALGIYNSSTGTITVTGNVTGGAGANTYGIYNSSTGSVAVNGGTVSAGSGQDSFAINCLNSDGVATLTNCNMVNTTTACAVRGPVVYHPGATNYIQWPKTTGGAGTYKYGKTIPAADVQSGVDGDGANAPATGTFTVPAVGDVVDGVTYGGGGVEYEGTFAVPAEADVKDGVTYGEDGTEYEGTLVGGGGAGGMGGHGMTGGIPG